MKLSLIFLSLLTAEALSRPINPKFRRRVHPRFNPDPDFAFDLGRYGHSSSSLYHDLSSFGGSSSSIPFGGGAISVGSPGPISGPTFASPPALDVASAAPGAGPAIPETPAPVDPGAPAAAVAPVSPAPVDGAAPANPPNFSEPPPLDVASASPGVKVDPSTFEAPGSANPPTSPDTPPSPDTPASPGTPPAPDTPASPGTAADLGPVAAVNADPTNPNSGATQNAIDSFNQNIAPTLEQGQPVDHSGDKDIRLGLDMFNKQHGGRSGITVGNKDVQVGIYRDFNPIRPLDTFDSSKPHRPSVLGVKANF